MNMTIGHNDHYTPPILGISMGDPAGIGPEVCIKAMRVASILQICRPVLFGDAAVIDQLAQQSGIEYDARILQLDSFLDQFASDRSLDQEKWTIVDFGNSPERFEPGTVSAESGNAAYNYIETAISSHLANRIDGIVTGPINKLSLNAAGYDYPGHTELFAAKTGANDFCMLQYSNIVSCSFVTTHCGYADVLKQLTQDRIENVIRLTNEAFIKINGTKPRLLVCGLNPHAGEDGLFGNREEEEIIFPAVRAAQANGMDVSGPLPPDTCFIPARLKEFDCVVCMYHDQGHIPLKALAFDCAVNTTLGLPIVRTSVDHGTAFDIVGENLANPNSMIEAIKLAALLARTVRSDSVAIPKMLRKQSARTKQ